MQSDLDDMFKIVLERVEPGQHAEVTGEPADVGERYCPMNDTFAVALRNPEQLTHDHQREAARISPDQIGGLALVESEAA